MVTVSAASRGPEHENSAQVDMSKLTQSELQALSLRCSSLRRRHRLASSDQFFLPKIDRSLFNESAGSRRQTYSPPDPASSAGYHHRNRVSGLISIPKLSAFPSEDDPERRENIAILRTLKFFIDQNPSKSFSHIDLIPPSLPAPVGVISDCLESFGDERKRKRGRKSRPKMNLNAEQRNNFEIPKAGILEMKNKNGVPVDVNALASLEDPYADELRKRTLGLQSEEELLAFLRDLGGEWGSRRKRRKIVDAGVFGDILPVGWKLLLGLRRRERHASVFCRRYVSPSGEQFISCKEIASYLRSYSGPQPTFHSLIQRTRMSNTQRDCMVDIVHETGQTVKSESQSLDVVSTPSAPIHSLPNESDKKTNSPGAENLAAFQVNDLFECHKCNTTFSEKDPYLQHLVSFHQRTMRRHRIGSSVGDGVIMKDGKFECQFCHKVFEERRRYNGHVGIHVRDYFRRKEESSGQESATRKMESSGGIELPSGMSKMDALLEIAQSSIIETSTTENQRNGRMSPNHSQDDHTVDLASKANTDIDVKVGASTIDVRMQNADSEQTLDEDFTDSEEECAISDVKGKTKEDSFHAPHVNIDLKCEKAVTDSFDEQKNNTEDEMRVGAYSQTETLLCGPGTGALDEKLVLTCRKENPNTEVKMLEIADGNKEHAQLDPVTSQQNPDCNIEPSDTQIPISKGENNLRNVDQREDSLAPLEELRYDEIERLELQFASVHELSHPLTEDTIDMTPSTTLKGQHDSAVPFGSEGLQLDAMAEGRQCTSSCVGCSVEFSHEANGSDMQSDSVDFMCPNCKVKISGQLNAFGNHPPADTNNCF